MVKRKRKKKIFIVTDHYDYEGYSDPKGVYSTKKKAERALKNCPRAFNQPDIHELVLNVPIEV